MKTTDKANIRIVDDTPANLSLMSKALQGQGCQQRRPCAGTGAGYTSRSHNLRFEKTVIPECLYRGSGFKINTIFPIKSSGMTR